MKRMAKRLEASQRRSDRLHATRERQLNGATAVWKHILLLRLTELAKTAPEITSPVTRDQRHTIRDQLRESSKSLPPYHTKWMLVDLARRSAGLQFA